MGADSPDDLLDSEIEENHLKRKSATELQKMADDVKSKQTPPTDIKKDDSGREKK